MRNRLLPLGYKTVNGDIVIDSNEAEIVKTIFADYCNGRSLKTLVNTLNERGVVFKENGAQWNKGRVYHILTDTRYKGVKSFPQIVAPDIFDRANALKASKSVGKKQIPVETEFIKEKVFCGKCGKQCVRIVEGKKKERWICSNGCKFGWRPTDEMLMSALQMMIDRIAVSPELLIRQSGDVGYKRTPEIMRQTNELARMNEQITPSFKVGKTLLFHLASSKFVACKEDKSIYTEYVVEQIQSVFERGKVDVEFMRNTLNKVLIIGKDEYAVEFINGVVLTNREVKNNAS